MSDLTHVAINATDLDASRAFYTGVFGWRAGSTEWGGFERLYRPDGSDPGVRVALQGRRELLPGVRTTGLEATFAVPDLGAVAAAVPALGGRVVMEPATIPGAGRVLFFADPDGNVAGALAPD
jgi:predicted enzyme related to lactoylglutathione lyase